MSRLQQPTRENSECRKLEAVPGRTHTNAVWRRQGGNGTAPRRQRCEGSSVLLRMLGNELITGQNPRAGQGPPAGTASPGDGE